MAIDIAVHALGNSVNGNPAPAPLWPRLDHQKGLAEATQSKTFVLGGPAVFILDPTVKVRIDFRLLADAASLDAPNSGEVLEAGQVRFYMVEKGGSYVLKTAVYV